MRRACSAAFRELSVFGGEEAPGTTEAGGDLVQDQEHAGTPAQIMDALQILGGIEPHSPRSLDDRFQDDGGHTVSTTLEFRFEPCKLFVAAGFSETRGGPRRKRVLHQHVPKELVHSVHRIAHRHRGEGVAMVAPSDGQEAIATGFAPRDPILEGQFHGHLHGDRSRVREKDTFQSLRSQGHESFTQGDRGLMGETAEHDMRHALQLCPYGLFDVRMSIAVNRGPP